MASPPGTPRTPPRRPYPIITQNLPQVRNSIGSSPRSGLKQERYDQLVKEFSDIDKDHNNVLSFDEIHNFLTYKQGENFDETLCKDIFSRMDKNYDGVVTLEEFVESYVEIEDLILRQIKVVTKEIKKCKGEVEENRNKIKKAEKTEFLGALGIMKGSVVTVGIKSAQNLYPCTTDGLANPYVIVECGDHKIETSILYNTLNPIWQEVYSFPVLSKGLQLKLVIMSKGLFGDKFIGKISIPLKSLYDQLKHEQYFSLSGETEGEKWQGRIFLELQWIWSKVKYLKDISFQWEKIIKEDEEKLELLKIQLDRLRKPFGYLTDFNKNDLGTPGSNTIQIEEKNSLKIEELTNGMINVIIENQGYLYVSLIIYMILSILVCFSRPDFVNVRDI
jgi:C2 domain/EF-hand domain pair